MGQGRENARIFLKENTDIREKLEHALRKKLEIPQPGNSSAGSGANGHASAAPATTHGEKPPVKTAAAAAGAEAAKAAAARQGGRPRGEDFFSSARKSFFGWSNY